MMQKTTLLRPLIGTFLLLQSVGLHAQIRIAESWNSLSTGQIVRIASLRERPDFAWKSDTAAVRFFLNLPAGYARDSALQWHEEGGLAGVEKRTQEQWLRSPLQLATEVYNYGGVLDELDFSNLWYAYFPSDEEGQIVCKSARVNAQLSRVKMSKGLEFDVVHNRGEGALFLLGVPFPLDTVSQRWMRLPSEQAALLPGTEHRFPSEFGPWSLQAFGTVSFVEKERTISDYRLSIVGQKDLRDQILEQTLWQSVDSGTVQPIPELYVAANLLNDALPDLLLLNTLSDGGLELVLWVSDDAPASALMREAGRWVLPASADTRVNPFGN
jgi:hypothetical protein